MTSSFSKFSAKCAHCGELRSFRTKALELKWSELHFKIKHPEISKPKRHEAPMLVGPNINSVRDIKQDVLITSDTTALLLTSKKPPGPKSRKARKLTIKKAVQEGHNPELVRNILDYGLTVLEKGGLTQ